MDRRDFLKNLGVLSGASIFSSEVKAGDYLTPFLYKLFLLREAKLRDDKLNEKLVEKLNHTKNTENLEDKIIHLRGEVPNTPSKDFIVGHYEELLKNFKGSFENTSEIYGVPLELMFAIATIEQGKPYSEFKTGIAVESPSGCKGIGQMSYDSFVHGIVWNWHLKNRKKLSSTPLEIFFPLLDDLDVKTRKDKSILVESYEKFPNKNDVKERGNFHGFLRYEKFLDEVEEILRPYYNSLFQKEINKTSLGDINGSEIQITSLGSYCKQLETYFKNWEFAVGSYNNGSGTTLNLINKYSRLNKDDNGKSRRFSLKNVKDIIKKEELSYNKIYSLEEMVDYFNHLRNTYDELKFLDKDYYAKTAVSRMELALHTGKNYEIYL